MVSLTPPGSTPVQKPSVASQPRFLLPPPSPSSQKTNGEDLAIPKYPGPHTTPRSPPRPPLALFIIPSPDLRPLIIVIASNPDLNDAPPPQPTPTSSEMGSAPPPSPPFKIFIGYDPREAAAYEVCVHSLLKHSSIPLDIRPINQSDLRSSGLYWRARGPTESTEFSFTRFLTPFLSSFSGWSLFVDCDFLYTADVASLLSLVDDRFALMCVHHVYEPKETTKMDGAVQTVYPRKNWSSMVLYNCAHPKNRVLTPDLVSRESGAFLHRFMWLEDRDIGEVPFVWNFLVGHNRVEDGYPKAIHYTMGGPWFDKYKDCEFADLWLKELEEMENEKKEKEEEDGKVTDQE